MGFVLQDTKLIDLKKIKSVHVMKKRIDKSLVSVRTSSSRYVKSTGDRARIILAHISC